MTTAVVSMAVLIVVGLVIDVAVRYKIRSEILFQAERTAARWSAAVRNGGAPRPIPATRDVDLIQLVDLHGRVLDASPQAADLPAVSRFRPPAYDRLQPRIECPRGRCLILMANRVSPAADAPTVFAGTLEPSVLATGDLEYLTAVAAVLVTVTVAWMTWWAVGRTLRPVAVIRERIAEITVSDLSLRVPVPAGDDEIAMLARTANRTLARLDAEVERQRRFSSTLSHELRTPITGLRTSLEEAILYPGDVDPRETVRGALTVTGRLEAIVDDLLAFARLAVDHGQREAIDLGALVTEEAASPGRVPVRVHAVPGVRVHGSRIRLIRLVDNLLGNARRHAESGVVVTLEPVGDRAVLSVLDDGPGIAPADRERVFERFVRLDDGRRRDPGGSGLGLALSREIAHDHAGTLCVEDSPGGALFVLRLPLLDGPAAGGVRAS
ncbi:HAMP domain-containing sensor histidine kinase [Microbispora oryzae]|uniref:HAMP domain-containing sensor histidine kinase n=1 Tax=Microbispora oryzae TaxID=2806554 RepID=UPI0027DAF3D1|nr:HAMP domain-containing sensor histidine kinase [Microbispora oryzae]